MCLKLVHLITDVNETNLKRMPQVTNTNKPLETKNRLELLDRSIVIQPYNALIISNLITHHPEILHKYNVKLKLLLYY